MRQKCFSKSNRASLHVYCAPIADEFKDLPSEARAPANARRDSLTSVAARKRGAAASLAGGEKAKNKRNSRSEIDASTNYSRAAPLGGPQRRVFGDVVNGGGYKAPAKAPAGKLTAPLFFVCEDEPTVSSKKPPSVRRAPPAVAQRAVERPAVVPALPDDDGPIERSAGRTHEEERRFLESIGRGGDWAALDAHDAAALAPRSRASSSVEKKPYTCPLSLVPSRVDDDDDDDARDGGLLHRPFVVEAGFEDCSHDALLAPPFLAPHCFEDLSSPVYDAAAIADLDSEIANTGI